MRRRFGPDQADDLIQEAFARVLPYTEVEIAKPRPLLMRIAANAAFERRRRDRTRVPEAAGYEPLHEAVAVARHDQETALLLKQVVLELPPKLQEVLILSRFEGLTHAEIGRRCGISTKTVEWRMARALAICAARLRD